MDNINDVSDDKIIVEINIISKEFRIGFPIRGPRLAFTKLSQTWMTALILHYFDQEYQIWIETDALSYKICGILTQLNSNGLSILHLVVFFSHKIITTQIWDKTHNGELLAIVKISKTYYPYLKDCKYAVFVFTDHNKLSYFINMKNLSSRPICWARELSRYHFQIDHCPGKAIGAVDTLSQYTQRNAEVKTTFQAKNPKILHCLQSSLGNVSGVTIDKVLFLHQVLTCWIAGML